MNQSTVSLYERLGRHAGISRITADLIKNHLSNPLLKTRFENIKDTARFERRAIEFFCAGSGGPEAYSGQDMLSTHRGMNISEQEFIAATDDVMNALEKNDVDLATRNDVLAIFWSLKGEVIRV
jgi:hemoglobin